MGWGWGGGGVGGMGKWGWGCRRGVERAGIGGVRWSGVGEGDDGGGGGRRGGREVGEEGRWESRGGRDRGCRGGGVMVGGERGYGLID